MPETTTIETPDGLMGVYLDGPGRPASAHVVLMFPRSGMDGFPQRIASWLAGNGYGVAVPDITHRCPRDMPIRDRKQHLRDEEIERDLDALVTDLRARARIGSAPIAIMGHCMGGRNALLGAGAFPGLFAGVIAYYGGDVMEGWGRPLSPYELLGRIRCPVLWFSGAHDKNPAPADAQRIEAELKRHGTDARFHLLADVGHAFEQNADRSPEEGMATERARAAALGFLASMVASPH